MQEGGGKEMAEGGMRYVENPAAVGDHNIILSSEKDAQGRWPAPSVPNFEAGRHKSNHGSDDDHHHGKKSVGDKFKALARRFKRSIARMKQMHGEDVEPSAGCIDLDELDPARRHEFPVVVLESDITVNTAGEAATAQDDQPVQGLPGRVDDERQLHRVDSFKETASGGTSVATCAISAAAGDEAGAKQACDKGVSVKEYVMRKLEPGEEDKALCRAITEAVNPTKSAGGASEVYGDTARSQDVDALS